MKIALIGNCQIESISICLNALMPGVSVTLHYSWNLGDQFDSISALMTHLQQFDVVLAHRFYDIAHLPFDALKGVANFVEFPVVNFSAFHPDCVYFVDADSRRIVRSILGDYNSALISFSFSSGLSQEQCHAAFREDVFDYIGYFSAWDSARDALAAEFKRCGFHAGDYITKWITKKPFMNSINHPRLFAVYDLVVDTLAKLAVPSSEEVNIEDYAADPLLRYPKWPIYPEIAAYYGVQGAYLFKSETKDDHSQYFYQLSQFIEHSYQAYATAGVKKFGFDLFDAWDKLKVADLIAKR
jgi:hypothetical protein